MKKILMGSLLASSLLLANSGLEVNINSDTLEVEADIYLNKHYDVSNDSNYYFTFGHLRTESDTTETQSLTTAVFKVINPYTDDNGISIGLGMKSVYTNQMAKTFFALPLSVYTRVEMSEVMYVDAEMSYAPRVLSFSAAHTYTEIKGKFNYKVLSDGYVFVGARSIKAKYDSGKVSKFDNSAFLGFEVRF